MSQNERELARSFSVKASAFENIGDLQGALDMYDECIFYWTILYDKDKKPEYWTEMSRNATSAARVLKAIDARAGDKTEYSEYSIVRHAWEKESALMFAREGLLETKKLKDTGELSKAIDIYDNCISRLETQPEKDKGRNIVIFLALSIIGKADVKDRMGDNADSVMLYEQGISLLRGFVEKYGMRGCADILASALNDKAVVLRKMGNIPGAVELYDQSITILRKLVEEEGQHEFAHDYATVTLRKGLVLAEMKDWGGAVKMYDQYIDLWHQLEKKEPENMTSDLAYALSYKAIALKESGELRKTVEVYRQCIEIRQGLIESGRRDLIESLARNLWSMAVAQKKMGDLDAAMKSYDRCILVWQRLVEQENKKRFLGELAWVQLNRICVLKQMAVLNENERQQAKNSFQNLIDETARTGRTDLIKQVKRFLKELAGDL